MCRLTAPVLMKLTFTFYLLCLHASGHAIDSFPYRFINLKVDITPLSDSEFTSLMIMALEP